MDKEQIAAAEMELRQLAAKCLDGGVGLILLDFQLAIRKAYPEPVNVDPVARKIVAYLREHMVTQ